MPEALTTSELQLLRETAGDLPASEWGGWIGACMGSLKGKGLIDARWQITPAGRAVLGADHA